MPRILAYPFVALMAFCVALLLWVLVGRIAFDGQADDYRGNASIILLIVWWSWVGVRAYSHEIKKPREEKNQLCAQAMEILGKMIVPESDLVTAIGAVRNRFPLIGEPRYRSSPDPSFDSMVELETQTFIIVLFGRNGAIKSWSVK